MFVNLFLLSSPLENCDCILLFSKMYRVPAAIVIIDLAQHVFFLLLKKKKKKKLVPIPAKKERINLPIMLA